MEKRNISKGTRVIALSTELGFNTQRREEGKSYVVKDTRYCDCCGLFLISLEGRATSKKILRCNCDYPLATKGLLWSDAFEFITLEEIQMSLNRAVEQENYEYAAEVRDILKKLTN